MNPKKMQVLRACGMQQHLNRMGRTMTEPSWLRGASEDAPGFGMFWAHSGSLAPMSSSTKWEMTQEMEIRMMKRRNGNHLHWTFEKSAMDKFMEDLRPAMLDDGRIILPVVNDKSAI